MRRGRRKYFSHVIESRDLMDKGRIIFLNGVTSSGKTSIAKAIQNISREHIYHLSNDMFHGLERQMINEKLVEEAHIGEYMAESIVLMYHAARVLAEQGTSIVIDGMLIEDDGFAAKYRQSHYKIMQDILSGFNIIMVEVLCPLEECRRRNIARGDRDENQSHEQNKLMNTTVNYDLSIDTYAETVEECSRKILQFYLRNDYNGGVPC